MKLTFVIHLLFAVSISAKTYSQTERFTLSLNDVTVKEVIKIIEAKSEYRFFYNDELSDISKRVTVNFTDTKIADVLNVLFNNTGITYKILENNLIVVAPETSIQQRKITGKVSDALSGEPLPGVNILIEGTTLGVTSDVDGNYSIEVPEANSVLVFSFLGYVVEKTVIADRSVIDMKLSPDVKTLDEVVVVGYGTVKKNDLTGSVGSVSSEAITAKGTTSLMSALQGTVAGVNITNTSARPGGGYSIQIRGQNSLKEASPLYVVDGVITSDIDFLNPADIEHIDILKDASSTAIFGSRGSNGVVLVQTKNANTVKKSKIHVSYDGYYGVRSTTRIPEFMDGREWMDFRTSAFYSWNTTTKTYELTTANRNSILQASTVINQRLYEEDYEDWIKIATRNGKQQNHYLSIAGSANDLTYNVGLGYQNEEGNFIQESFDRYNVKISINHKPSKYFQSGATANLSQTNYDAGSQFGYRDIMKMPGILHAYDALGNMVPQPGIKDVINGTGNFTSTANPLLEIQSGSQETRRQDIVASIFAQVTPIEGLDIKSTISPRFNRTRIGKYYGVVPSNRTVDYASTDNSESFEYTWDNQISLNKTFNKHHIGATFINSVYHTRYENIIVAAQNFPYKSDWYNIYSGTLVAGDCKSSYAETSMLSYAGRINYDYKGKYLATATIRYDGSSKLADKWAAFPSFALAWRVSEENFMENNWLSNLKLRFSYGYSGNNNGVNAYSTQTSPVTSSNVYYDYNGTVASGFAPGSPVNPNLTWEKTRELNIGLDYGFFKGRISGTIDVYDKLSDGLLMSRALAIESGVASMTDNIGSVSNKGIEVSLTTVNLSNKDFYWSTNFTFAHNTNEIVSLYGKKEDVVGEKRFIGEPINVIYDYKILGVWTQAEYNAGLTTTGTYTALPGEAKTMDVSGNGVLGAEDKVILGSPDPKWTGSLASTFQFRNWDFSFNIYTKQGVFLFDRFTEQYGYNTQRGMAKVKFDYYMPANAPTIDWNNFLVDGNGQATAQWGTGVGNENTAFPLYKNANGAYYGDNGNYQDASFIKVKNITLGYTFGKDLVKKIRLGSLRLYVNILNPFTFTDYVGWDPEYAATQLVDGNGPSSIVYQFGINAKF